MYKFKQNCSLKVKLTTKIHIVADEVDLSNIWAKFENYEEYLYLHNFDRTTKNYHLHVVCQESRLEYL